ncbi:MAG: hypothetical protein WCD18_05425 [Thermosynechococcaceae cyanobacterium]
MFLPDLDEDYLVGLSVEELQALSAGMLAPAAQIQLDSLLARNTEGQLSADEDAILERLLSQIDHLNILKTRARYTLNHLNRASAAV